jgi:hypothetical protein
VLSIQRFALVGLPLTASTVSTFVLKKRYQRIQDLQRSLYLCVSLNKAGSSSLTPHP